MYISERQNAANGFKKWSLAHPVAGNDDEQPPDGATVALEKPLRRASEATRRSKLSLL